MEIGRKNEKTISFIILFFIGMIALSFFAMSGCTTVPTTSPVQSQDPSQQHAVEDSTVNAPTSTIVASWEKKVPARAKWTQVTAAEVQKNLATLSKAPDIVNFCPTYKVLNDNLKTYVWVEFFSRLSFYESGWDQTAFSVDVGTPNNKDTWSVGLLQLSVVDQSNLKIPMGYKFEDLKVAEKNLPFGVKIMANQVAKRGKILIKKGEKGNPAAYWAPLIVGGTYDKSTKIASEVASLSFCK